MKRKLFCEISPLTYRISELKCRVVRNISDTGRNFARTKGAKLPELCYAHKSLIRRKLGNVDMTLQENKAVNLAIACSKINGILIRPGEEFSFWRLVGLPKEKDGYKRGLVISRGKVSDGIGGGLCQLSNLIHWMVLHSPLEITEQHHHDALDLFPDHDRKVPFGVGTSIMYNYIDYRFKNNTGNTFRISVKTGEEYLFGSLTCDRELMLKYDIVCENEYFARESDGIYRNNEIYRNIIDVRTGNIIKRELIRKNHAKIQYDEKYVADRIVEYADNKL